VVTKNEQPNRVARQQNHLLDERQRFNVVRKSKRVEKSVKKGGKPAKDGGRRAPGTTKSRARFTAGKAGPRKVRRKLLKEPEIRSSRPRITSNVGGTFYLYIKDAEIPKPMFRAKWMFA